MSDLKDVPKAHPQKKRKTAAKLSLADITPTTSATSFAQEAEKVLKQLRASTMPDYAFRNPLESIDPLRGMRAMAEMSRGVSLAANELSSKHIRDMMKGIEPLGEAKNASFMAQSASKAMRILSHNPAKDALEQIRATNQLFNDATSAIRGITDSPMHDILKNIDPLHESKTVSRLTADAFAALNNIATNPLKDILSSLDSLKKTMPQPIWGTCAMRGIADNSLQRLTNEFNHVHKTMGVNHAAFKEATAWQMLVSNPLKGLFETSNPLSQLKTVSQMVSEASTAMLDASSSLRSVMKKFSAARDIIRGVKNLQHFFASRPISHSIDALDKLKQIQESISIIGFPLEDRIPAFGNVNVSTYIKHTSPAFAGGFTAKAAQEAAIGMATSISEAAVSAESEKLFSREEIKDVLAAIHEVLLSKDDQRRNEVAKQFSTNPAFVFMMSIITSILAYFIITYSQQASKELEIHKRSLPAIEYAMNSNDKPHIGIIRRNGGARVYEKPDKRSALAHKFIEGEFIALMWERQKGWRKVAYEMDLGTMKALKVGWIQDSDYDRTNLPVKSLFLRLYVEQ